MTFQKLSLINHVTNAEELIVLRKFPDHFTDFLRKKEGWLGATRFKLIKCPFLYCGVFELFGRWSEYPPPPSIAHTFKNVTTFSDLESLCSYRYIWNYWLNQWISCEGQVILMVIPSNKKTNTNKSTEKPKFYLTF